MGDRHKRKIVELVLLALAITAVVFYLAKEADWNVIPEETPAESELFPTFSEAVEIVGESSGESSAESEPESSAQDEDELNAPTNDGLPHDKLFVTAERQKYQDGEMTLIIPKLNIKCKIQNGTTLKKLKGGPGLFDYAQLPGKGNRNVSIAGHRDRPFFYINELKDGDYLYLVYQQKVYRYRYLDTKLVEPSDWGPIYSQGFSCLTLVSCEPWDTATHRIIVRSKLTAINDLTDNDSYPADQASEKQQASK